MRVRHVDIIAAREALEATRRPGIVVRDRLGRIFGTVYEERRPGDTILAYVGSAAFRRQRKKQSRPVGKRPIARALKGESVIAEELPMVRTTRRTIAQLGGGQRSMPLIRAIRDVGTPKKRALVAELGNVSFKSPARQVAKAIRAALDPAKRHGRVREWQDMDEAEREQLRKKYGRGA